MHKENCGNDLMPVTREDLRALHLLLCGPHQALPRVTQMPARDYPPATRKVGERVWPVATEEKACRRQLPWEYTDPPGGMAQPPSGDTRAPQQMGGSGRPLVARGLFTLGIARASTMQCAADSLGQGRASMPPRGSEARARAMAEPVTRTPEPLSPKHRKNVISGKQVSPFRSCTLCVCAYRGELRDKKWLGCRATSLCLPHSVHLSREGPVPIPPTFSPS